MSLEVKYELTPADLVLYEKEASKGRDEYPVQLIVFIALFFLFFLADIILSFFLTFTPTTSLGVNLLVRSLVGLAILVGAGVVLNRVANGAANKLRSIAGPNGVLCEHTFALDEKGFTETTHVNKNFGTWAGVEGVAETDNFVTVVVRLGGSHFIPKRAFADADELRTFVSTVRNYISPGSGDISKPSITVDY